MSRPRVLHVVECYGGGVASALDQYVRATPGLEHHLLRRLRDDFAEDGQHDRFATVAELPRGPLTARRAVRAHVRALAPEVVHAHSSFAGLFVRTTLLRRRPRVVYTAHGYGFERQDVGPLVRRGFELAERLLALTTDAYAACSAREVDLTRRVAPRRPVVLLPNAADLVVEPRRRPDPSVPCLVGMGRLGASKDPALFAAVVEEVRRLSGPVDAVWVGDGPEEWVAPLRAAAVEVTGWLPRREGLAVLAGATAYVSTSAWESGPMALLEAEAHGVPILARRLPAFAHCPGDYLADSALELAEKVAKVLGSADEQARNRAAWGATFAGHDAAGQRAALHAAYALGSRVTT